MVRFFAPDQILKRAREWGAGEFDRRYNEALQAYIRHSRGWLHIVEGLDQRVGEVFDRVSETRSALTKGTCSLCTAKKLKLDWLGQGADGPRGCQMVKAQPPWNTPSSIHVL